MVYFDYSATTPVHPDVAGSIYEVLTKYYGNPSSLHKLGVEAEKLVTRSREQMAALLQVPASTIIFTSGGTESNNMAIRGVAGMWRSRGRHIITTAVEHASVYDTCQRLAAYGFEVTVLPVDRFGRVDPKRVAEAVREDTILVSIMMVNNEVGTIQPIEQIAAELKRYPKVIFHVDAVQAAGKIPLYPGKLGVDLMSLSAHKFHGPKGIGLLYKREGLKIDPIITGGGQETGLRSGTENVPYIVGMAKAFRLAVQEQPAAYRRVSELRRALLEQIADIPGIELNSPRDEEKAVPHIVNISCTGMKSEVIVHALEQRGYYISSRSACSSHEHKPSRILLAMGLGEERASSGLRISLAQDHTPEQIEGLAKALRETVGELKQVMR